MFLLSKLDRIHGLKETKIHSERPFARGMFDCALENAKGGVHIDDGIALLVTSGNGTRPTLLWKNFGE